MLPWRLRPPRSWARRARARRPARESETMHLADHCIPRHPAEATGDLACAQAIRPKFFSSSTLSSFQAMVGLLILTQNPPSRRETAFESR